MARESHVTLPIDALAVCRDAAQDLPDGPVRASLDAKLQAAIEWHLGHWWRDAVKLDLTPAEAAALTTILHARRLARGGRSNGSNA